MTWYPTQVHYPDTEPTSPCPVLIMLTTWLGNNAYQFDKSLDWLHHGFELTISRMRDSYYTGTRIIRFSSTHAWDWVVSAPNSQCVSNPNVGHHLTEADRDRKLTHSLTHSHLCSVTSWLRTTSGSVTRSNIWRHNLMRFARYRKRK